MVKNLDHQLASVNLARALQHLNKQMDKALRPLGLRRGQHSMLLAIADVQTPSLTELARRLDIDKAAVSRSVASLELHQWVKVTYAPESTKQRRVELTAAGLEKVEQIQVALLQIEQNLKAQVSDAEYQVLCSLRLE